MAPEFGGIERRLDELIVRLQRLAPLSERPRPDFDADPYLRDIVERNLEVAAQCVVDISNRIISLEGTRKPRDNYEAILLLAETGVLPPEFARKLAPITGLRNVLVHEYLALDWNQIYKRLQDTDDLLRFAGYVRAWLLKADQATGRD